MTRADVAVAELRSWEEIAPYRDEWNALLEASPGDTLFVRHEWLENWWLHFAGGRRLALFVAREGGRLVAALPLLEERGSVGGAPATILRSLTNAHAFRYNALARPGSTGALAAIWTHLRRRERPWDVVMMEEVPDDARVIDPLLDAARADGARVGVWHGADVPYLPTSGTWEAYHASLSKNMRANLRKKGRRLEEEGEVSFRRLREPSEVAEGMRAGLALEGSGWKAQAGSAILSDETLSRFYTRWAEIAAANGWLRLSFLDVNGTPVAFDFSTLYGGRYYDLKMGYDPAWERFSVGQLLKARILEACFGDETGEYDFLGASMRAKDDWMPRKRGHDWYFVFRPGLYGRWLHDLKFVLAPAAKRILGR
ncbi:MAG TPA: GNAT family N-acetyltransferase [Acidobacteriota bacterium]|nr:GNAT family N-acetyltransferase [Acidobacteriota bacterium]